jgi:hypothetical protein
VTPAFLPAARIQGRKIRGFAAGYAGKTMNPSGKAAPGWPKGDTATGEML